MHVGVNKNLASKVLSLEKELQSEKKRRLEAEKKLIDHLNSVNPSGFQSMHEQDDM